MPIPWSRTVEPRARHLPRGRRPRPACPAPYFTALARRFVTTWSRRSRSHRPTAGVEASSRSSQPARAISSSNRAGHLAHELGEVELLELELEPPCADARDVEEVRDEAGQAVDVAADDLCLLRDRLGHPPARRRRAQAVSLQGQGGERRLELMGRDGEELVADPDRLLGPAIEPGGVDGRHHQPCQVPQQDQVRSLEAARAGAGGEGDGAERLTSRTERHGGERAESRRPQPLQVLGAARDPPQRRLVDALRHAAVGALQRRRRADAALRIEQHLRQREPGAPCDLGIAVPHQADGSSGSTSSTTHQSHWSRAARVATSPSVAW